MCVTSFMFRCVSIFSVSTENSVYSSVTMGVAENMPSKDFRVFKTVLMYVVQILNMTFTFLLLLTLLSSEHLNIFGIFNVLQSAISGCRPFIICSLNSSTLHMVISLLLKQLCACKCQAQYSYISGLSLWSAQWSTNWGLSKHKTEDLCHSTAIVSLPMCKLPLVFALSVSRRLIE